MYWGHSHIQGVNRCMGGVQMYGGIQTYRGCTYVWGCTDVWGMHRYRRAYRCMGDVQMYGEHTDVWGDVQMYGGVQMWGHTGTSRHTDSQTPPHACTLHLGTIFLTELKFVLYRHIMLGHQLA